MSPSLRVSPRQGHLPGSATRRRVRIAKGDAFAQAAGPSHSSRSAELLKKLNNPVSDIISLPIENDFEFGLGPEHAWRYTMKLQPVLPFSLSDDWLVITRMVMPIIAQPSLVPGGDDTFGLSDTTLTFFFSPKHISHGLIWGVGPVLLFPAATDKELGAHKWGAGPSAVVIKQERGWTIGALLDHVWSFAGSGSNDVSATLIDPFVIHSWENGFGAKLETEASYDWEASQWTVPLEAGVSQLVTVGQRPIRLGADVLYYVERGPNDLRWGLRFTVTFIFKE